LERVLEKPPPVCGQIDRYRKRQRRAILEVHSCAWFDSNFGKITFCTQLLSTKTLRSRLFRLYSIGLPTYNLIFK